MTVVVLSTVSTRNPVTRQCRGVSAGAGTVEEDQRLAQAELAKRMPDGWQEADDVFARYKVANIKLL